MHTLKIINIETVNSTNGYAMELAESGEKEIVVVKAQLQTKGRGRRAHVWLSPDGGIYASFLLRPPNPLKEIAHLPMIFALGVCNFLKGIVDTQTKKPNDVLVNGKKIAGILVETRSNAKKSDFAIVGVGININSKKDDIPPEATSLFLETKNTYNIEDLFERLIKEEISLYREFKKGNMSGVGAKL